MAVVFKSIDTDNNGFLTHDELLRRLLRVHQLKHKGEVSQEAVLKALEEIFLIDDNTDGKISLAEWMKHAPTSNVIRTLLEPIC
jgi:Ca2+-binding EF-hand superfamily protein